MNLFRLLPLSALLAISSTAEALVVNSLPYVGTSDWSDIQFSDTVMAYNGSSTSLTTADGRGVWFGNLAGSNEPAWNLGSANTGNELQLTAAFSAGSADWSAYMGDAFWGAGINFNPTFCADNCYGQPVQAGLALYHAVSASDRTAVATFVPLDLSTSHTFGWLLKDGELAYRLDGATVFRGYAYAMPWVGLVIGDGSGPTLTGVGSMTISAVRFDTAPTGSVSSVPEPASAVLLLAGAAGLLISSSRRPCRG